MREANEQDKEKIVEYLKMGLHDCLYLYIDIMNYGIASDNMTVWVEEEQGELGLVVMKYYDSFQVYSHKHQCNMEGILELLHRHPVAMISGRKNIIQELEKKMEDYRAVYGAVYSLEKYRKIKDTNRIQAATPEDAREIAELICSDEGLGGHYTVQILASQLAERMRTQTGRSYIIRENGEIVAHNATYAEAEGIAIVSGTIVKPEYRNTNYYMLISSYLTQELLAEGKTAYSFSVSERVINLLDRKQTKCGEYGKLVKKKKAD